MAAGAGEEAISALREASPFLKSKWNDNHPTVGVNWTTTKEDCGTEYEVVTSIRIERGQKLPTLPKEIGNLVRLKKLHLESCDKITTLPAQIGLLHKLILLKLYNCTKLKSLPDEIGDLTELETLELLGCEALAVLPNTVGRLFKMKSVNLEDCRALVELPSTIGRLQALGNLCLKNCSSLKALPPEFGQLSALKTMELTGCSALALIDGCKEQDVTESIVTQYRTMLVSTLVKPKEATKLLLDPPHAETISTFFDHTLQQPDNADWLSRLMEVDASIARVVDAKGRPVCSDAAHITCKLAMQSALYLCGLYEVDSTEPLHSSATAVVLASTEHSTQHGQRADRKHRRALKAMRDPRQALAEITGRVGLDQASGSLVVKLLAVYVDESLAEKAELCEAARRLGLNKEHGTFKVVPSLADTLDRTLQQRATEVIAAESSDDGTRKQGRTRYRCLLVFDLADRALATALMHGRVAATEWPLVRKIGSDVAHAVLHLHENQRIHADLKPLNILRVRQVEDGLGKEKKDGNFTTFFKWMLIDLDVSCTIGKNFGTKTPSSGYCPPEMAQVLVEATDAATGKVDTSKLSTYTASVAFDLWSFGVVLFHLGTGKSLWHTNHDDSVSQDDLQALADWDESKLRQKLREGFGADELKDKVALRDLLFKLLDPSPTARLEKFQPPPGQKEMEMVLKHPFFDAKSLDDATIATLQADVAKIQVDVSKILRLSKEHLFELQRTREALLKGIFEATSIHTPTAFIILDTELPPAPDVSLGSNEHDELALAAAEKLGEAELATSRSWLDMLSTISDGIAKGDHHTKVFQVLASRLKGLVTGTAMYFYLVDELTGEPVRGPGYPIKISKPSEIVPMLLPVMQVGLRAMALLNGAAGVARMFGYPVPQVPEAWRRNAQHSVELLKQESSVARFGASETDGEGQVATVRGESLARLAKFLKEHNKGDGEYAGLRRIGGDDGVAIWTALQDAHVRGAIEKRAAERRREEENSRRALLDMVESAEGARTGTAEVSEGEAGSSTTPSPEQLRAHSAHTVMTREMLKQVSDQVAQQGQMQEDLKRALVSELRQVREELREGMRERSSAVGSTPKARTIGMARLAFWRRARSRRAGTERAILQNTQL